MLKIQIKNLPRRIYSFLLWYHTDPFLLYHTKNEIRSDAVVKNRLLLQIHEALCEFLAGYLKGLLTLCSFP